MRRAGAGPVAAGVAGRPCRDSQGRSEAGTSEVGAGGDTLLRKAWKNAVSPRERAGVRQPAVSTVLNDEQRDGPTSAAYGDAKR